MKNSCTMTYDLLGIGLGPFNLGLAALSADIPNFTIAFIEQKETFDWHPGLLLPGARLQVPFYADLVTLVCPQSKFSWFSFLQAKQRLFRFGVQDNPFPLRREYNEYGQWVAGQLPNLHFGQRVDSVAYDEKEKVYGVHLLDVKTGIHKTFHAKHLVIGIGSIPYWPACAKDINSPFIFHASDYLFNKPKIAAADRITIIGSGQSAAEIFQDTLNVPAIRTLSWFTRSPRFFPMETTPAAFELSGPDYREHFYRLPTTMKEFILAGQDALYKGINADLLSSIYEQLYERMLDNPSDATALYPNCELQEGQFDSKEIRCVFRHRETGELFDHTTDVLILATGYQPAPLTVLDAVRNRLNFLPSGMPELSRNYSITADHTIFLQNQDLHSHGFASADLSFGPYRNAVILNTILGREHFRLEQQTIFQSFDRTRKEGSCGAPLNQD